jgi:hypothetical protein
LATALQFVDEVTVEAAQESAVARTMARFFFASFWTVLFTGAVRKWIFPGTSAFYLLQDVPITLAYIYALWKGAYDRGVIFLAILLLSAVLMMQGLLQVIVIGLNFFVALVGVHHYLYYLPILIVFPIFLTEKYRRNFIWWNLMLSIPMCLLAISQSLSPKSAWVNRTSEGEAFGVPGADVARVSGTFNFVSFYGIWAATAVALCMGEWLLPKHRRVIQKPWLMILVTFTVNLCHLVSASRAAILLAALAIIGALVCAFVLGAMRPIAAILGIFFMLPVLAGVTYIISPAEVNIVIDRFTGDRGVSDSKARVVEGLIDFATVPEFSLMGAGIGVGVDAAHVGNLDAYNFTYNLSEEDTVRNVMELGTPVGLLYVLARLFFFYGMILFAIRIARSGSTPHVVPMSFFLIATGYADMTRNATMTATQILFGYAFILSAYYHPDNAAVLESQADDSLMRSV